MGPKQKKIHPNLYFKRANTNSRTLIIYRLLTNSMKKYWNNPTGRIPNIPYSLYIVPYKRTPAQEPEKITKRVLIKTWEVKDNKEYRHRYFLSEYKTIMPNWKKHQGIMSRTL